MQAKCKPKREYFIKHDNLGATHETTTEETRGAGSVAYQYAYPHVQWQEP
jgi:hypothetical protein